MVRCKIYMPDWLHIGIFSSASSAIEKPNSIRRTEGQGYCFHLQILVGAPTFYMYLIHSSFSKLIYNPPNPHLSTTKQASHQTFNYRTVCSLQIHVAHLNNDREHVDDYIVNALTHEIVDSFLIPGLGIPAIYLHCNNILFFHHWILRSCPTRRQKYLIR